MRGRETTYIAEDPLVLVRVIEPLDGRVTLGALESLFALVPTI